MKLFHFGNCAYRPCDGKIRYVIIIYIFLAAKAYAVEKTADTSLVYKSLRTAHQLNYTNPDSALKLTGLALQAASRAGVDSMLDDASYSLAEIYFNSGNHHLALDYYFKARGLLEKKTTDQMSRKQMTRLVYVYHNIGSSYFELEMTELSKKYLLRSLELAAASNAQMPEVLSQSLIMYMTFNVGSILLELKDYNKARELFDKVEAFSQQTNDTALRLNLLINNGIYYENTNNLPKAKACYDEAITLALQIGDQRSLARIHNNLGEYYVIVGSRQKAIENYRMAMELGNGISAWRSVKIAVEALSGLYAEAGNYRKAFDMSEKAHHLGDSLFNADKFEKYSKLNLQYEFDKELRINDIRSQKLFLQEKSRKMIFFGTFLITLLLLVITLFVIRNMYARSRLATMEQRTKGLENDKILIEKAAMQREIDLRNRQLAEKAMLIVQKNEFITHLADELRQLSEDLPDQCGKNLARLVRELKNNDGDNLWKEFEVRFGEVHQDFYNALNNKHPDLTSGEKKLAAFLRLNLSTKEIAAITFQSPDSIKVARSRLRKKLGILQDENLVAHIGGI